jgi:site-specific DNA-methyltransferase (adenine-specific)
MNIIHGDSLDKLKELEDNSVDSIVTDPPYGLSFMGKKWDYDVPSQEIWEECLRVLKPGGYLLAFAGTRTQHRMAVRIEDAGFEIRDMIAWVYGSGFPKSLNIGKAVDKLQGNERVVVGTNTNVRKADLQKNTILEGGFKEDNITTKGTSPYEGYGTALKPALEPITVARKPISEKTVAENVLKYGTGGINIDGSRVEATKEDVDGLFRTPSRGGKPGEFNSCGVIQSKPSELGRFPANLIHDGSDEVVGLFPNTKSGAMNGTYKNTMMKGTPGERDGKEIHLQQQASQGSASRFFYCAKASKSERNAGCEGLEEKQYSHDGREKEIENAFQRNKSVATNNHPTVKPISLMRYLCRLVTPKGGIVLDPFMGSGTTGIGAKLEGFDFIGIEREAEYIKIAEARINAWEKEKQKKLV